MLLLFYMLKIHDSSHFITLLSMNSLGWERVGQAPIRNTRTKKENWTIEQKFSNWMSHPNFLNWPSVVGVSPGSVVET